jgi:hypothetical protein
LTLTVRTAAQEPLETSSCRTSTNHLPSSLEVGSSSTVNSDSAAATSSSGSYSHAESSSSKSSGLPSSKVAAKATAHVVTSYDFVSTGKREFRHLMPYQRPVPSQRPSWWHQMLAASCMPVACCQPADVGTSLYLCMLLYHCSTFISLNCFYAAPDCAAPRDVDQGSTCEGSTAEEAAIISTHARFKVRFSCAPGH